MVRLPEHVAGAHRQQTGIRTHRPQGVGEMHRAIDIDGHRVALSARSHLGDGSQVQHTVWRRLGHGIPHRPGIDQVDGSAAPCPHRRETR